MRNPVVGMFRSIFAFIALVAVVGVHAQQKINVTAANSVTNQIYSVSFTPPTGSRSATLNNDQGSLQRLVSLAFISNIDPNQGNFSFDLLAADTLMHHILRYTGDFTCPPNTNPPCGRTGTLVTQAAAILSPNGLSVDTALNLYAVNDTPGKSPKPQVWVLQTDGAGGFQPAFAIDNTSPAGSLGKAQAVVETMPVPAPLGTSNCGHPPCAFANTNDLLVVSNSPDAILLYPGTGATGPLVANHHPQTLIPQCANNQALNCIPAGSLPQGIAVWPADNSLLITLKNGSILRFSLNGGTLTQLATVGGLPAGLVKIKTGLLQEAGFQFGPARAFVTQSGQGNHGSILELAPSAQNGIVVRASVTSGIAAPQGIVVSNTVQAPTANCAQGCDNFGNELLKHTVIPDVTGSGNLNSNLVESLCVAQDPRVVNGVCNGNPLTVNTVCPGFDNTNVPGHPMTIPGTFCGASGSSGNGFALIKSLTAPNQFNNTYVEVEQNTDALFPNAANPVCGNNGGTAVVVWAPLAGETQIVEEGVNIANPTDPNRMPTMVDITEGCGTGKGGKPALSVAAVGLAMNTNNLTSFAHDKYPSLISTIQQLLANGNINDPGVAQKLTNVGGTGCVDLSLQAFNAGNYQDAADLLTNADPTGNTTCDSIVTQNLGAFTETPATPVYNPSGQIRWRLANLYYTIETRILNQPAASSWPPPVSLSASAQGIFAQCTGPSACPTLQNPTTATLSWALASGVHANNCSWSSNDGAFTSSLPNVGQSPATLGQYMGSYSASTYYPGATYTYTLTCTGLSAGTMGSTPETLTAAPAGNSYIGGTFAPPAPGWPNATASSYVVTLSTGQMISGCMFTNGSTSFSCPSTHITGTPSTRINVSPTTMSVTTNLKVWQAILVTATPNPVVGGNPVTVTWTLPATAPANAAGCTLATNGQGTLGASTLVSGSYQATYMSSPNDDGNTVTFTAACPAGASPGIAQVMVIFPFVTVSLNPTSVSGGNPTQITWTPPAGATGCTLTSNGDQTQNPNPLATDSGPASGSAEPVATYTSTVTDSQTNGGIVTITGACTAGASTGNAQLTVTPPPP